MDLNESLEKAYSGRLVQHEDHHGADKYYEVPTVLFVGKIDLKMPPLPAVGFYRCNSGKIEAFRKPEEPYSALALSTMPSVLVHENELGKIKTYAESLLLGMTATKGVSPEKRIESLRKAAILIVEDLFQNPSKANIDKSVRVVGSFVYLLMREPQAYLMLSKLSSHDHYTLQHSVGAGVNSIILGRKSGIKTEAELTELGVAGLLHDLGKVKVKKEIINKKGPLNEEEWVEMRQHSTFSYELIKDHPDITERSKLAVLQHHEDKTGKGYPSQIKWDQVTLFAKIVAISDIFNALTTTRSYSDAKPPFEAFEIIRDKIKHKIDEDLFANLVKIYGGDVA